MDDIIRNGIQNGIPFPDIYEWTVGEIIDFSKCRHNARKEKLREDALMYYKTASLIARMVGCAFSGKNSVRFHVMEEYSWLWNDKERETARKEALMQEFMNSLMIQSKNAETEGGNTDG